MAPLDECSVLLPSSTLEDFPVGGTESDARSLLAGWTVLWHPLLLAQTQQMPTWYRADAPPNPDGPRMIVVPEPSKDLIPTDFRRKCEANPQCVWITGADRSEMLRALELDPSDPAVAPLEISGRFVGVEDFFAAGYMMLQIQIMTRRLRYTSNIDELHLQRRISEAAVAFRDRDAASAAEGLHDVFDCLSEERDHYFSTDPHLIDLTLLTPKVLDDAVDAGWLDRLDSMSTADDDGQGVIGVARNVLVDGDVAVAMCDRQENGDVKFRELLQKDTIGWAGGGAAGQSGSVSEAHSGNEGASSVGPSCLDAMTIAAARTTFESGTRLAQRAIGVSPRVYGQLSGMTPADLIPALSGLGYAGVIPIDFSSGTGFGDESKVIVSGGGAEMEALTAKPIDAASDIAFLSIGARLGEAIDTGEIATGLFVHWPDRVCDSFKDLCRAATWSVALGRFWTLDRYFTDGERPYHNGSLDSVSRQAAAEVAEALLIEGCDTTLQSMATEFCQLVQAETDRTAIAITRLAAPRLLDESGDDMPPVEKEVLSALGVQAMSNGAEPADIVCFNPHAVGMRCQAELSGGAPPAKPYVYAATAGQHGHADVTFDVPAMGFTRLSGIRPAKRVGLFKRLTGGQTGIADGAILRNEFMAVSLDETSGGVSGVFSASRGNRLSVRLVAADGLAGGKSGGEMVCQRLEVVRSDAAAGIIKVIGTLQSNDSIPLASFSISYRLNRGSRQLQMQGTVEPKKLPAAAVTADFWHRYFAIRTAIAGEAAIMRPLVRDKVHSSATKRMVAPLGVLIDEAEKQTLVASHGLPLHRKSGDRFLDTIVGLPDGQEHAKTIDFQLTYVLDSPAPVAVARACIAPGDVLAVNPSPPAGAGGSDSTQQAWLVHVSAAEVLVTEMQVARRSDGKLAARMQLVQTRPKTAKVKLQFCVHAQAAFVADPSGIDRTLDELPQDVSCDDGVVQLSIGNHETIDLVVVFDV